jgi:hypothetical protein
MIAAVGTLERVETALKVLGMVNAVPTEALGAIGELTMLLERRANERPAAAAVRPAEMLETATATGWVP